jgi:hypothetical protein
MDKAQALYAFWASFGLPAYDEQIVPKGAKLPYITYETATASLDEPLMLSASLWYSSESWAGVTAKANEIERTVNPFYVLPTDGGRLVIFKAAPFSRRMGDPDDAKIKRIILQIQAEFLSA